MITICYTCKGIMKGDGRKMPVIYSQCGKCQKKGEKKGGET
jgi:hypothetical protein